MPETSYTSDEMMTIAAARMVRNGAVLFVGIGLPSAAANLALRTHAPDTVLIYESGCIGSKPDVLPLSIGDGELAETADAVAESAATGGERLPIRMLHDRVLASTEGEAGERQTGHGLVIPATASIGKRLAWAAVVATGQHVRQVQIGDRVLYDPEDRAEVELHSKGYVLLRERDIHAVAAPRVEADPTGLYL